MKTKIIMIALCFIMPVLSIAQGPVQAPAKKPLPIIDIHVHSMSVGTFQMGDICPWFLENMPGTDPKTGMSFPVKDCVDPWKPAKNDDELTAAFLETIERLTPT